MSNEAPQAAPVPARPTSRAASAYLATFFRQLMALGVEHVVVSPGSRSTPLAMVAHALSCESHASWGFKLHIDVDERGAGFFALGLAKASGKPVCLVCTSGTAVANYYPAVMEASSSRVPLLLLTADRPPRLWGLGAPQTCDQLNVFGGYVRTFRQMPMPGEGAPELAFVRQAALEAYNACAGCEACSAPAGPVQLNFPFDNPLLPDLSLTGELAFDNPVCARPVSVVDAECALPSSTCDELLDKFVRRDLLFVVGEQDTCESARGDLDEIVRLAEVLGAPIIADPLSGLRGHEHSQIIDAYDEVFATSLRPSSTRGELVVRFGRYPVSKACTTTLFAPGEQKGARPEQVVVDPCETRDFNARTDLFVRCTPGAFAASLARAASNRAGGYEPSGEQRAYLAAWQKANARAAQGFAERASACGDVFEGAYVSELLALAPRDSLLWVASSMSIRAVDQFCRASRNLPRMLCNRGLNGIDGTVSSALGAAVAQGGQTTLLIGDLAFLHDINALHLQHELLGAHGGQEVPSIVVVLLNNAGGGIFDLLPQSSPEPYFERLFLTPQRVDFAHAAAAFGVPYAQVQTLDEFRGQYQAMLATPGISVLEVRFPLTGTKERYLHV